jgi:hypothetical protein
LSDDPTPFLGVPLRVEEKLDGANVTLWMHNGQPQVMSRGGVGAMDRGRQLGRLRAWVAEHNEAVASLCADGSAAYAEWLWRRHSVAYDALPDWLIVLDLWRSDRGFSDPAERDRRARSAGVWTPPTRRIDAVLRSPDDALALLGAAAWSSQPAEGVVMRNATGDRCKVVRSGFNQLQDAAWGGTNSLAA